MFAQYQLTVHRGSWQQGTVSAVCLWWALTEVDNIYQSFSCWSVKALFLPTLIKPYHCWKVFDAWWFLVKSHEQSCPWDLESKTIIKSNHDSLLIILPKNKSGQMQQWCVPVILSLNQHDTNSTWCNPLCWVWQPLSDWFVYMCYCFSSSLWCYLRCIVFSKFPGSLCKRHHSKHKRVSSTLNVSFKSAVISLMSHVRWQMISYSKLAWA